MANDNWRAEEARAHEAKAEALDLARDTLQGVLDIVAKTNRGTLETALTTLQMEAGGHHDAAKLAAPSNGARLTPVKEEAR